MGVDAREYRDALGSFATGVTVITTVDGEGELFGLTANSFTSLSLDPPLVLFCLDNNAMSYNAFNQAPNFAVNILCDQQQDVSSHFAQSGADKWNGIEYTTWESGCPILPGCLTSLECRTRRIVEGGDHVIVVGEVERIGAVNGDDRPLLFFKGRYGAISQ